MFSPHLPQSAAAASAPSLATNTTTASPFTSTTRSAPRRTDRAVVTRILQELNSKWDLELPLKPDAASASVAASAGTNTNPQQPPTIQTLQRRCVKLITQLYYTTQVDLDKIVTSFEEFARTAATNWVLKPGQESGTLPRSDGFDSSLQGLRGKKIDAHTREILVKYLKGLLNDEWWIWTEGRRAIGEQNVTPTRERQDGQISLSQGEFKRPAPRQSGAGAAFSRSMSDGDMSLDRSRNFNPIAVNQLTGNASSTTAGTASRPSDSSVSTVRAKRKTDDVETEVFSYSEALSYPPMSSLSARPSSSRLDGASLGPGDEGQTSPSKRANTLSSPNQRSASISPTTKRQSKIDAFFVSKKSADPHVQRRLFENKSTQVQAAAGEPMRRSSAESARRPSVQSTKRPSIGAMQPPYTSFASTDTTNQTDVFSIASRDGITSMETSFLTEMSDQLHDENTVVGPSDSRGKEPALTTRPNSPKSDIFNTQSSVFGDSDFEESFREACKTSILPETNASTSANESVDSGLVQRLRDLGPFAKRKRWEGTIPLAHRHELTRIAATWDIDAADLFRGGHFPTNDYVGFWKWARDHPRREDRPLPERTSSEVWGCAVDGFQGSNQNSAIVISGQLDWAPKNSTGIFDLALKPLKLDRSCRLHRRFGSDRFMAITTPGLSKGYLPEHLKGQKYLAESVVEWLINSEHHCLERVWKPFYVEEIKAKKKIKNNKDIHKFRIHFFAIDGADFLRSGVSARTNVGPYGSNSKSRRPMAIGDLLNWHIPIAANVNSTDCKAFQRFALGLSKTVASVVVKAEEVVHLHDAHIVMNDGCARMSETMARHIWRLVGTDSKSVPSAFQGRFAGAKGMWMVDKDENMPRLGNRNFCIEVTDSQLKIKPHPCEMFNADDEQMTFEVNAFSTSLKPADLNVQLLNILYHRGVPKENLGEMLKRDTNMSFSGLAGSMSSALSCRLWVQNYGQFTEARYKTGSIKYNGDFPDEDAEQLILLLESGFQPGESSLVTELLRKFLKNSLARYVEQMKIRVPYSTYAFCIADPMGILEPDEVHLGFSQIWSPEFGETELHNRDVLLGRLPALLPSDIQKRRAVWHPDLRQFKDVIVFPTKGDRPLADMLSGGDYDGDTIWVCWEPLLVDRFENALPPAKTPSTKELGLKSVAMKLDRIFSDVETGGFSEGEVAEFMRRTFNFNLEPSFLGQCTNEHEVLCYNKGTIDCPEAITLAVLASQLVDSRKAGMLFTETAWHAVRKATNPKKIGYPAYKNGGTPRADSIIDYMKFEVAEPTRERILESFSRTWSRSDFKADSDLIRPWMDMLARAEKEKLRGSTVLHKFLNQVHREITDARSVWTRGWARDPEPNISFTSFTSSSFDSTSDKTRGTFASRVQAAMDTFNAIKPPPSDHKLIETWREQAERGEPFSNWVQLRASCAYHQQLHTAMYPWYVAGDTLCRIKAMATSSPPVGQPSTGRKGRGGRLITDEVYLALKIDRKAVKRLENNVLPADFGLGLGDVQRVGTGGRGTQRRSQAIVPIGDSSEDEFFDVDDAGSVVFEMGGLL